LNSGGTNQRGLRGLVALLFALLWMLVLCGPLGALIHLIGPFPSALICATGFAFGLYLCIRAFKAGTRIDAVSAILALLLLLPTLLLMAFCILIAASGGFRITPFM
jgi:hypothetical protein